MGLVVKKVLYVIALLSNTILNSSMVLMRMVVIFLSCFGDTPLS